MDKGYIKAESIINNAKYELTKIFEKAESKGLESREAYILLENLIERLESAEEKMKYLASPTKEGVLAEDSRTEKFYIAYDDEAESYNLSCGNTLEIFYDNEWHIGRVEAKDGKYYFYGEDQPFLHVGMRAAKRVIG